MTRAGYPSFRPLEYVHPELLISICDGLGHKGYFNRVRHPHLPFETAEHRGGSTPFFLSRPPALAISHSLACRNH